MTVTAAPASGWIFNGWVDQADPSDFVSTSESYSFRMRADRHLTARFVHYCTLWTSVEGAGLISRVDPRNAPNYLDGEVVILEATASPGWQFDHWEDDYTGDEDVPVTSVTMSGDQKEVKAVFKEAVVDLKFRSFKREWQQGGGFIYVEEWVDDIEVVPCDTVAVKAEQCGVAGLTYNWDLHSRKNTDSSDSDRDGRDENTDDVDKTGCDFAIVCPEDYEGMLPNQDPLPNHFDTVTLNVSSGSETFVGNDQGRIDFNDALVIKFSSVARLPLIPHSLAKDELLYLEYFVDVFKNMSRSDFKGRLPNYRIFVYSGHAEAYPQPNGETRVFCYLNGGGDTFDADMVTSGRTARAAPSGGQRSYTFVQLGACHTAEDSGLRQAWNTEAFQGWLGDANSLHVYFYDRSFWHYVASGEGTCAASQKAHQDTMYWYLWDYCLPFAVGDVRLVKW